MPPKYMTQVIDFEASWKSHFQFAPSEEVPDGFIQSCLIYSNSLIYGIDIMAMINKELYDALLEANVSDEKATAAARSLVSGGEDTADLKARLTFAEEFQVSGKEHIADLKARLASVEASRSAGKKHIADIKEDTSGIKVDIANMKVDISNTKVEISNMKLDISNLKEDASNMKLDIAGIKADIADLKARLLLAEKLQWAILISVIGILIKDFVA